jgi:hypothetical protein
MKKSVINIKNPGKYNVIDHEKCFLKQNYPWIIVISLITHKANHYNPHSESSRY